jgi:hypothetical protein
MARPSDLGGGIGGLIAAYALAQKGFPVRVFEQSPEFREVGAGIQLGPKIFRVLEKVGLKEPCWPTRTVLQHRRCATRSPASYHQYSSGRCFLQKVRPALCRDPSPISTVPFSGMQGSRITLERAGASTPRDHGDGVTLR